MISVGKKNKMPGYCAEKRRFAAAGAFLLLLPVLLPARALAQDMKHVLVLHSYHKGLAWTDSEDQGIRAALQARAGELEVHTEYLDSKTVKSEDYDRRFSALLEAKYASIPLKAVISTDDDAYAFYLRNRALFRGAPLVFCGVNYFQESQLKGREDLVTGVIEAFDIPATLETALRLHPGTKRVVIINDSTTTGLANKKIIAAEVVPRFSRRVSFVFFENLTMRELLEKTAALSEGDIVLLMTFNRDRAGAVYNYEQSINLIAGQTQVPLYGIWDFYLGRGIVGGRLTSGVDQGKTAGELALRLLDGAKPRELPIVRQSPNRYMFDQRQLERFAISTSALPPGSLVLNAPVSFYQLHKGLVWWSAIVFAALAAILLLLLQNIYRRKRGETALARTHLHLEKTSRFMTALLSAIPTPVFYKDKDGRYLGCNRAFTELMGVTSEAIRGKTVYELWPGEHAKTYHAKDLELMAHPARQVYEFKVRDKDGLEHPVIYAKDVFRDENDQAAGIVGAFLDITRLKQAETELQATSQQLMDIVDFLPDATFVIDKDKKVIAWNRALERMTGIPKSEMLGKGDFAYSVPWYGERRPILIDLIGAENEKIEKTYDYVYRAPDGTLYSEVFVPSLNRGKGAHVWVTASPLIGSDGKPYGAIESVRDVTARKHAEEMLAESEDKFKTLAEKSKVGIYLVQDNVFKYVNPAMSEFFGYTAEELVGKKGPKDVIFPEDLPLVLENLRKRLVGEIESVNYDFRCIKKTGEIFYAEAYGAKTTYARKPAAIGTLLDITERKKAQTVILKLNAELEKRVEERTVQLAEVNKELEAFSYSAAHDMKAPLRRLNTFAELLAKEAGPGLQQGLRGYLRSISKAATQMTLLVDGLLKLSTTGKKTLELAPVRLADLLKETIAEIQAETAGRAITWVAAELPETNCDRAMIKQVFLNLLGNAVKYTRDRADARIEIFLASTKDEHVIGVRDNGVGFDPAYADRLFVVFQRLHRAEEFEGSGIGLSTVKRIISRHGGRVWAQAVPGQGATFYFTLPRAAVTLCP